MDVPDLSRFAAANHSGHTKVSRRERPPTGSAKRHPFAAIPRHMFSVFGPAWALFMELIRQDNLPSVKREGGWVRLSDDSLRILGLSNRNARHRAVQRLVDLGYAEIKAVGRHRLQYRLNSDWAKPKPEVIALVKARKKVRDA